MSGQQKWKFGAAMLLAASVLASTVAGAGTIPQTGAEAPGFTLPSQDGQPVSLKNLRGKWVVLYFYPKDGTSGCTLEAHNFQHDLSQYEAHNAIIVGVSVDSTGSHKEFCAKQGLTFKLLSDDQKQVSAEYGSLRSILGLKIAARNTFLIDPQGRIARVWTAVGPSTHSSEVLAALSAVTAKK